MFTRWDQIEDWIRDNGFKHWAFYKENPDGKDRLANNRILDSNHYGDDYEDKIAMTRKYLEQYGAKAWGVGWRLPNGTQEGLVCEVVLSGGYPGAAPAGVGQSVQPLDIQGFKDEIRESIRREMQMENFERERKEFEQERKEFREMESGVWGLIVQKIGMPLLATMQQKRMVAGVDADAPVHADPVQPIIPNNAPEQHEDPEETQEPEVFTDEESDKLFDLMKRFKAVEPDYMRLLEAVVTMAENGDITYTTAKGFLVK